MRKQKQKQTGSKSKGKEKNGLVSSKIEHTKDTPATSSLFAYRKSIKDMTQDIKKYAVGLCPDNLLSVKMSLMGAVRDVEIMIKERREK